MRSTLCDLLTFHSVCIGVRGVKCHVCLATSWCYIVCIGVRGVKCHVYLVTSWYFIVQYICISVHGGQMSCYFVTVTKQTWHLTPRTPMQTLWNVRRSQSRHDIWPPWTLKQTAFNVRSLSSCISVHGGQMSCYFVTSGRSIVIALVFTKVKYVYLATTMPFSVCSSVHEGEMSCVLQKLCNIRSPCDLEQ
jgi:hypothetical protein